MGFSRKKNGNFFYFLKFLNIQNHCNVSLFILLNQFIIRHYLLSDIRVVPDIPYPSLLNTISSILNFDGYFFAVFSPRIPFWMGAFLNASESSIKWFSTWQSIPHDHPLWIRHESAAKYNRQFYAPNNGFYCLMFTFSDGWGFVRQHAYARTLCENELH